MLKAFDSGIDVENTVRALLQVSDIVLSVSKGFVIDRVWGTNNDALYEALSTFEGANISENTDSYFFADLFQLLSNGNAVNERRKVIFEISDKGVRVKCVAKVVFGLLPDHILVAIEQSEVTEKGTIDETWRLALDAAGDGVWDIHIPSGTISFSAKWYVSFGFAPNEITRLQEWLAKVHPEDLKTTQGRFHSYLEGHDSLYETEFRYYHGNGSIRWILSRGMIAARDEEGQPLRIVGTHTDISARKAMEEDFHANISLLKKLMNSLPNGILVTDEAKKLVFANQAFCEMYGISQDPDALTGTNTEESLQRDKLFYKYPDQLISRIREIISEKKIVLSDELEMLDGRTISRDYIPLTFNENHRGEIWKFTDVTAQKDVEKRFETQRLFYEQILNGIAADIAVHDAEQRFLFINPKAIKDPILRRWMIGKKHEDYCRYRNLPMSIAEERNRRFAVCIGEKRQVEFEEKLERPGVPPVYYLRCLFPVLNEEGNIDIVIVYGIDITDRKLAEEALKTSMKAFEHSFNFSGIGKALIGPAGEWLEVNGEMCKLFGYSRDEFLHMYAKDIIYPDDAKADAENIGKLLNKEIETYTIEKRYVSKSRQIVNASVTVSLLWNADNTPKYFICDIVDITASKQLSDELYRQNAALEAARANLINKITQLEDLSYMIAHNLRGPANNIKMLSERLIIDDDDPRAADEVFTKDEAGAIIHESSLSLSNSLNTLMELTQIKLNKSIAYDDCMLQVYIGDILNQLQSVIFEKHARFTYDLQVPLVKYPKVYLESILYNLISNALKYSRADVPPEILISSRKEEDRVVLSVKDNGLGIDLEKYGDKVFVLNKVFHKGFDSKGVGLFLTKSQVESLGGSIAVKSTVNEGSEFIVKL